MDNVKLPQDDSFLTNQLVQWWYWTGHIKTESGRRFGFELCFFAVDVEAAHLFQMIAEKIHGKDIPDDLLTVQMMNTAITDIDNQQFFSRVEYKPGPPKEIKDGFDLSNILASCLAQGGNGEDHLVSKVDKFELDIQIKSQSPATIHYDGEKHEYSFGGYTYYYSRENMLGEGTLTYDGKTENVAAQVWFDRQYGQLLQAAFLIGWQWFAIQLDDDIQVMLFAYHDKKEHMGSISYSDGSTVALGADDFSVTILDHWKSPHTGRKYPSKWQAKFKNFDLLITPSVADQELYEPWLFPKYWEGACSVTGSHNGSAYVELTGYARHKLLAEILEKL